MITLDKLYELYINADMTVTTDSRVCPAGSLFFALKGPSFNGNAFAESALAKGCSYAIIDDSEYATSERCIVVDDVLKTLQALAKYHRAQLNIPVIGITGTNGKTTSKELTASVLAKKYNVLYTQGNFNNHIGVPLTILQLRKEHDIAVIEMGANHIGEIKTLVNIACPDCGFITNVGKAHLEGFGSLQGVIRTKCELYDYLDIHGGTIFANANNQYLMHELRDRHCVQYGMDNQYAEVSAHITSCSPFISITWKNKQGKEYSVDTKFIGTYNAENMLAAITVGLHYGVRPEDINCALSEYTPTNNRSQLKKTEHNTLVIDAYNANPTSMEAAINNFIAMEMPNKMLILGDMLELGEHSSMEHAHIVSLLMSAKFTDVILVGEEFCAVKSHYPSYKNVESLKKWLNDNPIKNHTILIKGSHGIGLQSIVDLL